MAYTRRSFIALALVVVLLAATADASIGDRLPEFQQCLDVCRGENCAPGTHTPIRTSSCLRRPCRALAPYHTSPVD